MKRPHLLANTIRHATRDPRRLAGQAAGWYLVVVGLWVLLQVGGLALAVWWRP